MDGVATVSDVERQLVRRSGGRSARRALAAAMVIGVALSSACSQEERSMVEGECLPSHAKVVGRVEANPPTVPCDEPHRYEVFAVGQLDNGPYPGDDETQSAARQLCYESFAPNVGFDATQMGDDIRVVTIPPSEQSWNNQADREVECLLIFTEDRSERVATPLGDRAG